MHIRRLFSKLINVAGMALMTFAAIGLAAWLTGRIVSDRYAWSQWLLWMPTPLALALAMIGLTGAMRPGGQPHCKRIRRIGWLVALFLLAGYFAVIEHRLLSFRRCAGGTLRIAHWNPSAAQVNDPAAGADAIISTDAHISILTNPGGMLHRDPVRQWLGDARPVRQYPFGVLTRLPILELRSVASAEHMRVVLLKVDTTEQFGRPITLLLIDLPSDPDRARMETAKRLRQWLDEAQLPEIDLYVGDFNLTRNSASLRTIAPQHEHAFNIAGTGYGATYPRGLPIVHIDHMLVSKELTGRIKAYCLRDPQTSHHLMQVIRLNGERRNTGNQDN